MTEIAFAFETEEKKIYEVDPTADLAPYGPRPKRDRLLSSFRDWTETCGMPHEHTLRWQLATGARIGEAAAVIGAAEVNQDKLALDITGFGNYPISSQLCNRTKG